MALPIGAQFANAAVAVGVALARAIPTRHYLQQGSTQLAAAMAAVVA